MVYSGKVTWPLFASKMEVSAAGGPPPLSSLASHQLSRPHRQSPLINIDLASTESLQQSPAKAFILASIFNSKDEEAEPAEVKKDAMALFLLPTLSSSGTRPALLFPTTLNSLASCLRAGAGSNSNPSFRSSSWSFESSNSACTSWKAASSGSEISSYFDIAGDRSQRCFLL